MIVVGLQELSNVASSHDARCEDIVSRLEVEGLLDFGERRVFEVQQDDADHEERGGFFCSKMLAASLEMK